MNTREGNPYWAEFDTAFSTALAQNGGQKLPHTVWALLRERYVDFVESPPEDPMLERARELSKVGTQ